MKITKELAYKANKLAQKAGFNRANSILFSADCNKPKVMAAMNSNFDYSKMRRARIYSPNRCIVMFPESEGEQSE